MGKKRIRRDSKWEMEKSDLAEPMTVPPLCMIPDTEAHSAFTMLSPPSTRPW